VVVGINFIRKDLEESFGELTRIFQGERFLSKRAMN